MQGAIHRREIDKGAQGVAPLGRPSDGGMEMVYFIISVACEQRSLYVVAWPVAWPSAQNRGSMSTRGLTGMSTQLTLQKLSRLHPPHSTDAPRTLSRATWGTKPFRHNQLARLCLVDTTGSHYISACSLAFSPDPAKVAEPCMRKSCGHVSVIN